MAKFSERYGYTKVSDVIIREEITMPILNGIANWLYRLKYGGGIDFKELERAVWIDYLYNREDYFHSSNGGYRIIIDPYISDENTKWYEVLNLIEFICDYLKWVKYRDYSACIECLNYEFERHNFAYRVVDTEIIEVTAKCETKEITQALTNSSDGVRTHLKTAMKCLSASQETPDYRNSIKESISAVEVLCREITGEQTLGQALGRLEANGVDIHLHIRNSMDKLYTYTNDKSTGIRHAQMDPKYAPTADEAIFMLVSCSAFINYLTKKNN
ncbi:MAG: hypothetical protein SNJ29_13340 [Rikenellaceae bacterium]